MSEHPLNINPARILIPPQTSESRQSSCRVHTRTEQSWQTQNNHRSEVKPDFQTLSNRYSSSSNSVRSDSNSSEDVVAPLLQKTTGALTQKRDSDKILVVEDEYSRGVYGSSTTCGKVGSFADIIDTPPIVDSGAAMDFIKQPMDMSIDIKLGWKPEEKVQGGAPIPLNYNFNVIKVVEYDPITGEQIEPLYLGPRYSNSIKMHKAFANQEGKKGDISPFPSYKFEFPLPTTDKNGKVVPQSRQHQITQLQQIKTEPPRPFEGMNPKLTHGQELRFDANFESGNLDMVYCIKPWEYDLYMRVDTNTRGHHQWFYFSISYDCPKHFSERKIKFNICNFTKPRSLYHYGMKVWVAMQSQKYSWHTAGDEIKYRMSKVGRNGGYSTRSYSCLTFTYTLPKNNKDKIYFAYSIPYTFSKLTNFLKAVSLEHKDSDFLKETILCKSLSGIPVPLLTITSRVHSDPTGYNLIKLEEFQDAESKVSIPFNKKKRYAVISGRVHPGECPSSWMMQGFLKCLMGDSLQAKQLRKRIVFKIVPMLNPDGVVIGNYRTSLSGNDLNRKFNQPDYRLHPTVWNIKRMTEHITCAYSEKGPKPENLQFYIDMHGHSRKKNVFMFGPQVPLHSDKYLKMRVLPKLLADETNMFRYHSCSFINEKCKEAAARISLAKEFSLFNCFTLEASFFGYFDKEKVTHEFTAEAYESIGVSLVNALYEYCLIVEEEERRKQLTKIERLKLKHKKEAEQQQQQSVSATKGKSTQPTKQATVKQISKANINMSQTTKAGDKLAPRKSKKKALSSASNNKQASTQVAETPETTESHKVIGRDPCQAQVKNPNEPDEVASQQSEDSVSSNSKQESSCSDDELSQVHQSEYNDQPKKIRCLADILNEMNQIESSSSEEEDPPDAQAQDDGPDDPDQGADDDELTEEQAKLVGGEILKSIKIFRKQNKLSEQQYFCNEQVLVDQPREDPQPLARVKSIKPQPFKPPLTNYQSNTVSINQKRKSQAEIPVTTEIKPSQSKKPQTDKPLRKMKEQSKPGSKMGRQPILGNTSDQPKQRIHQKQQQHMYSKYVMQPQTFENSVAQSAYEEAYEFLKQHTNELRHDSSITKIIIDAQNHLARQGYLIPPITQSQFQTAPVQPTTEQPSPKNWHHHPHRNILQHQSVFQNILPDQLPRPKHIKHNQNELRVSGFKDQSSKAAIQTQEQQEDYLYRQVPNAFATKIQHHKNKRTNFQKQLYDDTAQKPYLQTKKLKMVQSRVESSAPNTATEENMLQTPIKPPRTHQPQSLPPSQQQSMLPEFSVQKRSLDQRIQFSAEKSKYKANSYQQSDEIMKQAAIRSFLQQPLNMAISETYDSFPLAGQTQQAWHVNQLSSQPQLAQNQQCSPRSQKLEALYKIQPRSQIDVQSPDFVALPPHQRSKEYNPAVSERRVSNRGAVKQSYDQQHSRHQQPQDDLNSGVAFQARRTYGNMRAVHQPSSHSDMNRSHYSEKNNKIMYASGNTSLQQQHQGGYRNQSNFHRMRTDI